MTSFPAAYCRTCEKFLSPQGGSRSSAEEAKKNHEDNRLTFEGFQHKIAIFESQSEWEAANG